MTVLSYAAAILIATLCQPVPPDKLVPAKLLVDEAVTESALTVEAIGKPNDDKTRDYGITQVNQKNFGFFRTNAAALIDETPIVVSGHTIPSGACEGFRVQADYWRYLGGYNAGPGLSTSPAALDYAAKVLKVSYQHPDPKPASVESTPTPQCAAPYWDLWAREACKHPNLGATTP